MPADRPPRPDQPGEGDDDPDKPDDGRWRVEGTRDQVTIVAALNPDGEIRTAYPKPGGPGVIENPKENQ